MTFSIIIPTYNGASYVREAIESALSQTRPADEVIISDDNSKDNTVDICRSYGSRVKIYQNPDGPSGFVNGWNNAINHAESEFIVILHQDDLLDPNFLEEIENCVRLHPDVKHFFAPCRYIDGNRTVLREPDDFCTGEIHRYTGQEYANAYERYKNHIHRCPGVVTHRDIFKQCKYRSIAGHIADDDFFLRVGNYTDVVGVLKPLASYREHKGSETGHLSFLSINHRLLRDYHFQLTHRNEIPLMSDEIINLFKTREVRYIHRLIFYGIKNFNLKYVLIAFSYWLRFNKTDKFMNLDTDARLIKRYLINLTNCFNHR